jgi:hypothetical protein
MQVIKKEKITTYEIYSAMDGTEFNTIEECRKYENSAKCVLLTKYKECCDVITSSEEELFYVGSCDNIIDVVKMNKPEAITVILQLISIYNPHSRQEDLDSRLKMLQEYYEKGSSEPTTRTISITDKDSLRSEYIYKQLRRASSFPNYAEVRDFIDIDKPTFRFDKFLEAIHIFNTQNSHFRQLGELRDKLKEALLNAEITDVKH